MVRILGAIGAFMLFVLASAAFVAPARADILAFTSLLRIAVPGRDACAKVIRNDFQTAPVHVFGPEALPAKLRGPFVNDKEAWSKVGADAVISTEVVGTKIHFAFYELYRGIRPTLSRSYPVTAGSDACHMFGNEILEHFTGTPASFGTRIAFERVFRGSRNIHTVESDGQNEQAVTHNRAHNVLPAWTPTGDVLFTSYAKRNPDLWRWHAGGVAPVSTEDGLNLGAAVSPDGRRIALALSRDGNSEVYSLDTDGRIQQRVTRNAAIDGSPSWSSDGRQLAFVSDRTGSPQIYVTEVDGGSARRLTTKGDYNTSPAWNPVPPPVSSEGPAEGDIEIGLPPWDLLAYSGRRDGRMQVFVISVRTGQEYLMSDDDPGNDTHPSWSPDGELLVYASSRHGLSIVAAGFVRMRTVRLGIRGESPSWGPYSTGPASRLAHAVGSKSTGSR